ncbi:GNAT family N-acetyltransferase [Jannaschia sp.]|nr:GNAT family N-acetyltransferase [Jannaschia sp.]
MLPLISALGAWHGDDATPDEGALRRDLADCWLWGVGIGAPLRGYALCHATAQAQFGRRGAELHHLYVAEALRGRGLGQRLIAAVEDQARARGCTYLSIGAVRGNAGARRCYEAAGYTFHEPTFWRFRKDL